jgi:UDP-N-acetylmuramoyl-tripeptide--D-alanyl-D-alanine ligase
MLRYILKQILAVIARGYLRRFKPAVIAVTGSVGKTSTKEAIGAVLKHKFNVRMSGGNLNNEFGVPLTIIGEWTHNYYSQGSGLLFWTRVILEGSLGLIVPSGRYPKVLVLEYGADQKGDIKNLVRNFRPDIGVITAVSKVPAHVENFASPAEVAEEKSNLIKNLKHNEFAILNYDDPTVLNMAQKTEAHVITYGFREGAVVRISDLDVTFDLHGDPLGIKFKVSTRDESDDFIVLGSLGPAQAMSVAVAVAVGLTYKMTLKEISSALAEHSGPAGRLRILRGIKNSVILDDSYNSLPASVSLALETLRDLNKFDASKRRVAILGDMLELGDYSVESHKSIGLLAATCADFLICVGERAKNIGASAAETMPLENVVYFDNSDQAKNGVKDLIKEKDIILVKGSQGIRTEKIVAAIMAQPERKSELLVRQSKKWLSK